MSIIVNDNMKSGGFTSTRKLGYKKMNDGYSRANRISTIMYEELLKKYVPEKNRPSEITSDTTNLVLKNLFSYALNGILKRYSEFDGTLENFKTTEDFSNTKSTLIGGYVFETDSSDQNRVFLDMKVIDNNRNVAHIKVNRNEIRMVASEIDFTNGTSILAKIYNNNTGYSYAEFDDIYLNNVNNPSERVSIKETLNSVINSSEYDADFTYQYYKSISYGPSDIGGVIIKSQKKQGAALIDGTSLTMSNNAISLIRTGTETLNYNLVDVIKNKVNNSYNIRVVDIIPDSTNKLVQIKSAKRENGQTTITTNQFTLEDLKGLPRNSSFGSGNYQLRTGCHNLGQYIEIAADTDFYGSGRLHLEPGRLYYWNSNGTYHDVSKVAFFMNIYSESSIDSYGIIDIELTGIAGSWYNSYNIYNMQETSQNLFLKNFPSGVQFAASGFWGESRYILAISSGKDSTGQFIDIYYTTCSTTKTTVDSKILYTPDIGTKKVYLSSLKFKHFFINDSN